MNTKFYQRPWIFLIPYLLSLWLFLLLGINEYYAIATMVVLIPNLMNTIYDKAVNKDVFNKPIGAKDIVILCVTLGLIVLVAICGFLFQDYFIAKKQFIGGMFTGMLIIFSVYVLFNKINTPREGAVDNLRN